MENPSKGHTLLLSLLQETTLLHYSNLLLCSQTLAEVPGGFVRGAKEEERSFCVLAEHSGSLGGSAYSRCTRGGGGARWCPPWCPGCALPLGRKQAVEALVAAPSTTTPSNANALRNSGRARRDEKRKAKGNKSLPLASNL